MWKSENSNHNLIRINFIPVIKNLSVSCSDCQKMFSARIHSVNLHAF